MDHRLPAIDRLRGVAMVLMASDHANEAFNPNRPMTDSVWFDDPSTPLSALEFGVRWLSHLCAPIFLFLAGTSLALSIAARRERGASAASIDRDLLARGAIVLAVDLTFINWVWEPGVFVLQVMTAIGVAMWLMIPARRLPAPALVALALAVLAGHEAFMPQGFVRGDGVGDWLTSLFVSPGIHGLDPSSGAPFEGRMPLVSVYPILPWWAIMALGHALGTHLLALRGRADGARRVARLLLACGVGALLLYATVRGLQTYGDARLARHDDSWTQWLHVSKYPPSVAYAALELGLAALLLAAFFRATRPTGEASPVRGDGPLVLFGQTAFFFYVAHIALYEAAAHAFGLHARDLDPARLGGHAPLVRALVAWSFGLLALLPLCRAYRAAKRARPASALRYF